MANTKTQQKRGEWPTVMVLPEAQDFTFGAFERDRRGRPTCGGHPCGTTGCAVGWVATAFGMDSANGWNKDGYNGAMEFPVGSPVYEFSKALAVELGEHPAVFEAEWLRAVSPDRSPVRGGLWALSEVFEDLDGSNRKLRVERAWRRAAEKCGYDVSNPIVIK